MGAVGAGLVGVSLGLLLLMLCMGCVVYMGYMTYMVEAEAV